MKKRLTELIYEKATELKCKIVSLAIEPDHVHLFLIPFLKNSATNKLIVCWLWLVCFSPHFLYEPHSPHSPSVANLNRNGINCLPDLAPKQIMHRIKGYSSYVLRKEFPHLKRMPSMWTRSYFVSTAGNVRSETIIRYIEAQGKQ